MVDREALSPLSKKSLISWLEKLEQSDTVKGRPFSYPFQQSVVLSALTLQQNPVICQKVMAEKATDIGNIVFNPR